MGGGAQIPHTGSIASDGGASMIGGSSMTTTSVRDVWNAAPRRSIHLTYKRLGDEMYFDLISLCWPCHNKIHGREKI